MDTSLSKLSIPWTDEEVDTLIEHYRDCGPSWDGWGDVLPDRTHRAIVEKAHRLGVKCARPSAFRDYGGEPDLSAELAVSVLDDTTRLRLALILREALV